jgi:Pyrrolidone-carboxylate peptidase (N-terminal pyroglutamyl peptidase)
LSSRDSSRLADIRPTHPRRSPRRWTAARSGATLCARLSCPCITRAARAAARLLSEHDPEAVLHVGLAAGRARLALERVAVNVMDYECADNAGYQARGEPCVAGGPVAYLSTLPLSEILDALGREGIPGYLSNTAGTYLCNQTLYSTLHAISAERRRTIAGFMHVPLSPAMVAASGLDQPSMDPGLCVRAVEIAVRVIGERLGAL